MGEIRGGIGGDRRKPADPRRMPQEEGQGWREGRGKEARESAESGRRAGAGGNAVNSRSHRKESLQIALYEEMPERV